MLLILVLHKETVRPIKVFTGKRRPTTVKVQLSTMAYTLDQALQPDIVWPQFRELVST